MYTNEEELLSIMPAILNRLEEAMQRPAYLINLQIDGGFPRHPELNQALEEVKNVLEEAYRVISSYQD